MTTYTCSYTHMTTSKNFCTWILCFSLSVTTLALSVWFHMLCTTIRSNFWPLCSTHALWHFQADSAQWHSFSLHIYAEKQWLYQRCQYLYDSFPYEISLSHSTLPFQFVLLDCWHHRYGRDDVGFSKRLCCQWQPQGAAIFILHLSCLNVEK